MIALLLLLFLLTRVPLAGDAETEITDVVTNLAAALSDNSPQRFLRVLDRNMAGYGQIEHDLRALAGDTDISCSIELIGNTGSADSQQADLDWYMVLRSQQDQNLIERRRTKVTIKMEKRGKKWVVTGFSPLSIFAAITVR